MSERHVTRVPTELQPHPTGHVAVTDARVGICKTERATGARGAERALAAEAPVVAGRSTRARVIGDSVSREGFRGSWVNIRGER